MSNVSFPDLGDVSNSTGMNNWFDGAAKYDVANHVSGFTVKAENCYWGPLVGGIPKFSTYGSVDIIPWLTQEPLNKQDRDVDEGPSRTKVLSAHPNPFNPVVRIRFEVAGGSQDVLVRIFDLAGRYVATLVEDRVSTGVHVAEWRGCDDDGQAVSAGVYLYRVRCGEGFEARGKLTLVR